MASFTSFPQQHHAERVHSPKSPLSLLEAATNANETAVVLALRSGADINACDARGRSVVGWEDVDAFDASYNLSKRLRILKMLLEHEDISFHALNAPQSFLRGATPLGLAAWLNIPEVVRLLLEHSPGLVSVNGMDALGATALMYAARDGSTQVVQHLLANGARPDYRDVNHRTSIQHALAHPQCLWLCESALKRHRARIPNADQVKKNVIEIGSGVDRALANMPVAAIHPRLSQAPSKQELTNLTHSLIFSISTSDVHQIHSLLFSSLPSVSSSSSSTPILVNSPDVHGWSPIHYCASVARPSCEILDLLYRAGADTSLFTLSGHGTALHCLAYKALASSPPSIRSFIRHLVLDLRAPLSARDQNKETCLHIAAEHGESPEVLAALLSCDTTGVVREMKNKRGLTALEVCRPQFKAVFGLSAEQGRCGSSASARTIKASTTSAMSDSSLATLAAENFKKQVLADRSSASLPAAVPPTERVDTSALPLRILETLRLSAKRLSDDSDTLDVPLVEALLRRASEMSDDLISHYRCRLNDAATELKSARAKYKQMDILVDDVTRLVENSYGQRFEEIERAWDTPDSVRRRTTDSGHSADSDATAVSTAEVQIVISKDEEDYEFVTAYSSVEFSVPPPLPSANPRFSFPAAISPDSYASPHSTNNHLGVFGDSSNYQSNRCVSVVEDHGLMKLMAPLIGSVPSRKKSRNSLRATASDESRSGTPVITEQRERKDSFVNGSRLKAWFKRKLLNDGPVAGAEALTSGYPASSNDLAYSDEGSHRPSRPRNPEPFDDAKRLALAHSRRVIATASKDLNRIDRSISHANTLITKADHSITQADRLIKKALGQRETTLDRIRLVQQMTEVQEALQDTILATSSDLPELNIAFPDDSDDFLPVSIPTSPRNSTLIFPKPPQSLSSKPSLSSLSSVTSTLINGSASHEEDEDNLRALRKLVTKKIEDKTDSALEEIEKVTDWLRVVKDCVVGLRNRSPSQLC